MSVWSSTHITSQCVFVYFKFQRSVESSGKLTVLRGRGDDLPHCDGRMYTYAYRERGSERVREWEWYGRSKEINRKKKGIWHNTSARWWFRENSLWHVTLAWNPLVETFASYFFTICPLSSKWWLENDLAGGVVVVVVVVKMEEAQIEADSLCTIQGKGAEE